MLKGIDVSSHQGAINWDKVKVDFAIIRCGYGDNINRQDDTQFINNVNGCIRNNIPFGVYLYSYATNLDGEASIQSEVNHVKRLIGGLSKKPFCVYIDMEDKSTIKVGKNMLTYYALEFCKQIKALGYKAGVYANENWFKNYLDCSKIASFGHSIWCAKYSSNKPNITSNYDIWQCGDNGRIEGINGNVDVNYMYNDIRGGVTPKPQPIIDNKVNVYYKVKTIKHGWLKEVKNLEDYAGWENSPILNVAIKVDKGSIRYRGTTINGKTFGWVTGYDINDIKNGYCGNNKEPLALIEVEYFTPNNIRPYKYAYYKVNNYSFQKDLIKGNGMDGYAGSKKVPMTKFQIEIK